ncbi:uncharacterized protein LOC129947138 [Eupeodes corollae]|uniref:uncharacterized protein LOC129947138 n=1 Tax=Eupeodes corollae TaxID=290404 RepID=UPI00249027E6|nr:uncharacterized protein LOC129947138 [Eupeodes corollae]
MDRFARAPSGFDELIKWNYTIILPPETAELKLFPQQQTIKVNTDGFEPRLEMLEKLEGKYVTVVIQDGYLHYLQKALRNGSELILLPEAIYNYQFVMFLPKHSIYLNIFNKKLKEFACAGITAKISSDSTIDRLTLRKLMNNPKAVALTGKRLRALYHIYIISVSISFGVFVLEKLSVRYERLEKYFMKIM